MPLLNKKHGKKDFYLKQNSSVNTNNMKYVEQGASLLIHIRQMLARFRSPDGATWKGVLQLKVLDIITDIFNCVLLFIT